MPSIGAKRHAEKVAAWGVDAVLVQGGEGGGHTGSVPTSLLLPQVVDAVDIPVVAAGGFFDGRGLVAALAYGAAGIGMGTRFLLTSDSTVPEPVKQRLPREGHRHGRRPRGRRRAAPGAAHRLVDELESGDPVHPAAARAAQRCRVQEESGATLADMMREGPAMKHAEELDWGQVLMAANTPMLLKAAMVDGRARPRRDGERSGRRCDR